MSANCRWCRKRPATQLDYDTLPEGDDGDLCWREWNSYADCYRIEEKMKDAAPEMLEALENILAEYSETGCIWDNSKALAAIAKAKGGKP